MILIHDRDRSVDHVHGGAFGRQVDRERKGIENQEDQNRVAAETDELLDAKIEGMADTVHPLSAPVFREATWPRSCKQGRWRKSSPCSSTGRRTPALW